MVPNLHRVVAELAFEDLAWWAEDAGAGEEAVPADGDGHVGAVAGGATGRNGAAEVATDGAFSLDYCLRVLGSDRFYCTGRGGGTLPPRMMFWLPTMFDFRETLFPVS